MKKFLVIFLCLNFLCAPAYCAITDDFAEKTLDKNLEIKSHKENVITDDFVQNSLNKNLKIKKNNKKKIYDDFAEKNQNKNPKIKTKIEINETIPSISKKNTNKKIVVIDDTNMQSVMVNIKEYFTTKQKIDEGDYIEFETLNPIKLQNAVYPAGTTVMARIETLSLNQIWGVPSDLVVGNFSINEIPLAGEISKTGANRSLWVRPCVVSFLLFFGAGLLFIPIRGGHAKITPSETYTLYAK